MLPRIHNPRLRRVRQELVERGIGGTFAWASAEVSCPLYWRGSEPSRVFGEALSGQTRLYIEEWGRFPGPMSR